MAGTKIMQFSHETIVAMLAAVLGFLGGLIPSISLALKNRAEAQVTAKKTDLDALRIIIDEMREDREQVKKDRDDERTRYEKRLSLLEAGSTEKDCVIADLQKKVDVLNDEKICLEEDMSTLAEYIDNLIGIMNRHDIPAPERPKLKCNHD